MKGKPKIFAILTILFFLFLTPHKTSANSEDRESRSLNFSSVSTETLQYVRVLKDGVWWIFVYDSGKLIDAYPE